MMAIFAISITIRQVLKQTLDGISRMTPAVYFAILVILRTLYNSDKNNVLLKSNGGKLKFSVP